MTVSTKSTVSAVERWASNAELIADVAQLGYLRSEWFTLDPTYGRGTWWKNWKPSSLVASDIDVAKSPIGRSIDFTAMPWDDHEFDVVAFDPPYKLNGTPTKEVDERYGVDVVRRWQDRHLLIRRGITECQRVLKPGGYLLVKCQDQVCSGQVRWQTREFADHAESLGMTLVDAMLSLGGREQPQTNPNGTPRRQVHARRNYSTLLILKASL